MCHMEEEWVSLALVQIRVLFTLFGIIHILMNGSVVFILDLDNIINRLNQSITVMFI